MFAQHRRVAAAVLLALLASLVGAMPAAAADDALSWSVQPADNAQGSGRPNFGYTMDPGETLRDAMVVTNSGDEVLTLDVVAADAYTTDTGQLDLLPSDAVSVDVGAWITLDATTVTVAPGESAEVGFTVSVPADATPGDHTGGVATSYVSQQAGSTVALDRRLGSRMHIRVNGDLTPGVDLTNLSVSYAQSGNPFGASAATVSYDVVNTGNTRITATALVTVAGAFGWAPAAAPLTELPELLPGGTAHQSVTIHGVWPLATATATVELLPVVIGSDTTLDPVTDDTSTAAVPWALLILVVLVVGGAVAAGVVRGRRTTTVVPSSGEPDRTEDESAPATDAD